MAFRTEFIKSADKKTDITESHWTPDAGNRFERKRRQLTCKCNNCLAKRTEQVLKLESEQSKT
jgi:hypothetical protein